MRTNTRVLLAAGFGVLATAATGMLATSSARPAAPRPHAAAAAVVAANAAGTCTANTGTTGGPLPLPPPVYTWTLPSTPSAPHAFTIDVLQQLRTAPPPSPTPAPLYCYVRAGARAQYVEAPTIYVYQGDTFTMTLADRIPPAIGPSPSPSPQAYAPDRCALLDYESSALPPPSAPGYLGRRRIVADMSPGDMIKNNTNFHTHGWHVSPDVDNVFKSVAQTANGVCTFRFAVRTNQPPGSYWYHAHLHGLAEEQVGGGLAGALVVVPRTVGPQLPDTVLLVKNYNGPPVALRQQIEQRRRNGPPPRMLGATGGVTASASPDPFNPPPDVSGDKFPAPVPPAPTACKTAARDSLAVNGVQIPTAPSDAVLARLLTIPTVNQPPGGPGMVYRVVNASSDSYLNVRMIASTGAYQPLTVLGRDGVPVNWDLENGRVDPAKPNAVTRNNVFLGPSNRVDVFVPAGFNGVIIGAQAVAPFCNGYLSFTGLPSRGIVRIVARNPALRASAALPGAAAGRAARPRVSASTPTFADLFARNAPVTGQHRALTFTDYDDGRFYVTETGSSPQTLPAPWVEHPFWLRPGVTPPAPSPLPAGAHYQADIWVKQLPPPQQTVEVWNIYNATGEAHTFHIHQLTFVALKSDYEPADAQRVFLDSIALPGATVTAPPPGAPSPQPNYPYLQPSLTQIKIDFSHVDKGTFVFHCHMLFHEDHGMMGIIHLY